MTPDQWMHLVGEPVRRRRQELRMTIRGAARLAEVSEGLWRTIESGKRTPAKGVVVTVNPKASTRAQVCRVLGWPADSIDRLLSGTPSTALHLSRQAPGGGRTIPLLDEVKELRQRLDDQEEVLRAVAQIAELLLRDATADVLDELGQTALTVLRAAQ